MAEITLTIVCDDIRRELGNKVSFMGVYDDLIRVPDFPFLFQKLGFVQKWKDLSNIKSFRLEVRAQGSQPLFIDGEVTPPETSKPLNEMIGQFLINLNNIQINEPGPITFTTYFNSSNKAACIHKIVIEKASPGELT